MSKQLQIKLLGSLQVKIGEDTAVFRTDAERTLLAYLAIHQGSPQRRDTLAGLLSPDRTDKEALTYLRNRLTRLRHSLGDDEAAPPWLEI
ncbi:MAG: winged helix-turn-helix domain-containing protein, partial [Anaerolineales bacterium]|nr:winged helix-turn-helix domain-containing protein [Anaerolineales bacterium]